MQVLQEEITALVLKELKQGRSSMPQGLLILSDALEVINSIKGKEDWSLRKYVQDLSCLYSNFELVKSWPRHNLFIYF